MQKNISISTVKNLYADLIYSKLFINEVDDLIIESVYSHIKILKAHKMQVSSQYGSYNIKEVNEFLSEGTAYTPFQIEKLNHSFSLQGLCHGKLKIGNVSSQFENITIEAVYAPVEIILDTATSCQLNGSATYGKINIKASQSSITGKSKNRSETAIGTIGVDETPKGVIQITSTRRDFVIRQ